MADFRLTRGRANVSQRLSDDQLSRLLSSAPWFIHTGLWSICVSWPLAMFRMRSCPNSSQKASF